MPDEPSAKPWLRRVPAPHPSRQPLELLERECQLTMTRRSGPGGQHRNKTSTAIVLLHRPTNIIGEASESRSQAKNRDVAMQRLRMALAIELRCEDITSEADEALREEHRGRGVWVAERNEQRPAVFSLVLDDALAADGELHQVALRWSTSASQLLKLLRSHSPALDYLNRMRGEHNLRPLR